MSAAAEIVGVLGFGANVWANWLIACKNDTGWIVRLLANVLWLIYGVWTTSIANILSSIVFAGINVYGLRRWRREHPLDAQIKRWFELYDSPCAFNGDWPTFKEFHAHDRALRARVGAKPCELCGGATP